MPASGRSAWVVERARKLAREREGRAERRAVNRSSILVYRRGREERKRVGRRQQLASYSRETKAGPGWWWCGSTCPGRLVIAQGRHGQAGSLLADVGGANRPFLSGFRWASSKDPTSSQRQDGACLDEISRPVCRCRRRSRCRMPRNLTPWGPCPTGMHASTLISTRPSSVTTIRWRRANTECRAIISTSPHPPVLHFADMSSVHLHVHQAGGI